MSFLSVPGGGDDPIMGDISRRRADLVVAKSRRESNQEFLGGAPIAGEAEAYAGSRTVHHGDCVSAADVEIIARRSATVALQQFMIKIGIDASDPFELQKDFLHLRAWREAVEEAKRRGLLTAVAVIVTGVFGAIYALVTHKL